MSSCLFIANLEQLSSQGRWAIASEEIEEKAFLFILSSAWTKMERPCEQRVDSKTSGWIVCSSKFVYGLFWTRVSHLEKNCVIMIALCVVIKQIHTSICYDDGVRVTIYYNITVSKVGTRSCVILNADFWSKSTLRHAVMTARSDFIVLGLIFIMTYNSFPFIVHSLHVLFPFMSNLDLTSRLSQTTWLILQFKFM